MYNALRTMRFGTLLSLVTVLLGFLIGIIFGGFNDVLKQHLKKEAHLVLETKYSGDVTKIDKVLEKSSSYLKRAHLHASAIGTTALVLILLMALLPITSKMQFITSISLGLGSLGYSTYWLLAGLWAPGIGNIEETKELLSILAIPSSALCVIGVVLTLWLTIQALFANARSGTS